MFEQDMSLYDDEEDVETFTQKDFWALAVDSPDLWFVNFYSPGKRCFDNRKRCRKVRQLARMCTRARARVCVCFFV